MKRIYTLFILSVLVSISAKVFAQFPTIYASKGTGPWATTGTWETFPGNATNTPGSLNSGTAAASAPSGTHYIYIRPGTTVTMGASKNCMGVTVASGGTLLAGGAFTLKLSTGGTGFLGPNSFGINNSGVIGQASDQITVEIPITAQNVTLTGTGTYILGRLRMVGSNPYNPVVTLDADMSFNQSANYGLTAIYTGATTTDNFTININAGKTVTLNNASGYFNNNSITGIGTYTYNINGTLDLSASTQTSSNLTAISPQDGSVTVNVGPAGLIKTGAAFNSSPTAPGVANLNIAAGGLIDATLATVFNFNGNAFVTNGSAVVKRTVPGDGTQINFPVKTAGGNNTPASISRLNTSGTSAVYTASVQNTFDNTPSDPTKCVQKQWNLSITGTPSASDTIRLSWLTSDNGTTFNPSGGVTIMHYTAGAWEYKNATVTGTGTAADPYIAKATGFTSYSPFGVTNVGVLPLSLLSFTGTNNGKQTDLNWTTENEMNVSNFGIEKSTDGIVFNNIHTTVASNTATTNHYSYTDATPLKGTVYYRLKMNDADGRFTYSRTVVVRGSKTAELSIYPNPVKDKLVAEHAAADENTLILIYSGDGKLVLTQKPNKGDIKTNLDVSNLKAGNYSIQIRTANAAGSLNFIKQ